MPLATSGLVLLLSWFAEHQLTPCMCWLDAIRAAVCKRERALLFSRPHFQLLVPLRNYCLAAQLNGNAFDSSQLSVMLACGLRWCVLFPMAAVTNYHGLGGLEKHKFILLLFQKSEV